jgi:hypothetical protein
MQIYAQAQADYGADVSRKSTTGLILFLGESAVHVIWKSQLQRIVTMSTAEAEYLALSSAVKQAFWFKKLLVVFGLKGPIPILSDNQAAIQIYIFIWLENEWQWAMLAWNMSHRGSKWPMLRPSHFPSCCLELIEHLWKWLLE